MKRSTIGIGFLGIIALAAGVFLGARLMGSVQSTQLPVIQGTAFPDPTPLPDFQLIDQDGQPYTSESLKGVWTFVYFGYTFCPDICPTTLQQLAVMERSINQHGLQDQVAYRFISVDPQRDTPQRLGEYAAYFSPSFRGATGTEEQLLALTRPLGILFVKVPGSDEENYLMDHSSVVLVINPEGELQALFSAPHDGATMASDFLELYEAIEG